MIRAPGKFEGELYATRFIYDQASTDGMLEEIGSMDGLGWYGSFSGTIRGRGPFHCIVNEDPQGFVHGTYYKTEAEMLAAWDDLVEEYDDFNKEEDA